MILLLAARAAAMTDPWDCPTPANLQELAAVEWADPEAVWDTAYAAAWAHVDPACVTSCTDAADCWEADCVTTAGAEVTYRDVWAWEDDFTYVDLTVRLPAGVETWTEITLSYDSHWAEWSATWVGTLDPAWPADESFVYDADWYEDEYESSESHRFTGGGCAWAVSTSEQLYWPEVPGYGKLDRWTANDITGEIRWQSCDVLAWQGYYEGIFGGVSVGTVEPRTGIPTGTTDADGDGFYAEDLDCDDTNAAAYPCAEDVLYDGVDSNCDGRNDYDADGDGHGDAAYGGTDCDDTRRGTHPGATETRCDGIDQDCDGADLCGGDTAEDTAADTDTAAPDTSDTASAEPPPSADAPDDEDETGCGRGGGAALILLFAMGLRKRR